jgi:hypothetical protein
MGAQPTKKCRQPAWQSVKGNLIHRCVLAAGGKWLTVRDAARLSDLFNLQEPNLIAGIRLADKPSPLYQLHVLSTLLRARISGDIAVIATLGHGNTLVPYSWRNRPASLAAKQSARPSKADRAPP